MSLNKTEKKHFYSSCFPVTVNNSTV